jgi:hypothetical protein
MDADERRAFERQQEEAMLSGTASLAEMEKQMRDETPVEFANRTLDEGLIDAVTAMVEICKMSSDDKLRFAAAKYILDRAFGSTSPTSGKYADKEADPLYDFIAKVVKASN